VYSKGLNIPVQDTLSWDTASALFQLTAMEKTIFTPEQRKLQELLRQIRLAAGLRQADLAQRLGLPQSFVSKYESGERRLDLLEIRQICEAVGISLEEFVHRIEKALK
jgi:ribosome-binding protein aMBF1 (putative translation factor)